MPIHNNIPININEKYSEKEISLIFELGEYIYSKYKLLSCLSEDDRYIEIKKQITDEYISKIEELKNEIDRYKLTNEINKETKEEEIKLLLSEQREMYSITEKSSQNEKMAMQEKILYLEKEVERLRESARNQRVEMDSLISQKANDKIKSEMQTMKQILFEKEKQNDNYRVLFENAIEKINKLTEKKDVVSIGKQGENQFMELAQSTFRDFDGFNITDVHKQGGSGDFHIQFRDFNVLVDSKLYSHKVNSTSREKIKRDLLKNEHMQFAWLVSLDTMIDKFDKAPFMFEWLSSQQCICYINSLFKMENPSELLRALYFSCKSLHSLIQNEEKEQTELSELRKKQLHIKEIAQKMVKNNRERETILTQLRQNMEKSDTFVRDLLNEQTGEYVNEYLGTIMKWWNLNIIDNSENKIKSTALWNQFKKDNTELAGKIDIATFKKIVVEDIPGIVIEKTGNASFDVIGKSLRIL